MKRLFIAAAMVSLLALAAFAQTPTPPARTAAANPAAGATGGGGSGVGGGRTRGRRWGLRKGGQCQQAHHCGGNK